MDRTEKVIDVAASDVDDLIKRFEEQGATVTKEEQENGLWTIYAHFSDGSDDSRESEIMGESANGGGSQDFP